MPPLIFGAVIGVALILGLAIGYYLRYLHALSKRSSVELDVKQKTLEAEQKAIHIIERAEAKAETLEREYKEAARTREAKLQHK